MSKRPWVASSVLDKEVTIMDIPYYVAFSIASVLFLVYFGFEGRKYWWGWLFGVASVAWLVYFIYSLIAT